MGSWGSQVRAIALCDLRECCSQDQSSYPVGQGEMTLQELKETFILLEREAGSGEQHTEGGACKSLWEAEEEAAGELSYLLQLP